jgi:predicted RNA-binding protein (virulence factor B family)
VELKPGQFNELAVVGRTADCLLLDAGMEGELRLPLDPACAAANPDADPEPVVRVFIYQDANGRPVPTRDAPLACVGEVAWLAVAAVSDVGAFVDWGPPKQLLVPFAEQPERLRVGQHALVRVYLDRRGRIVGSTRIDRWLSDEAGDLKPGAAVSLLVARRTELGYKVIVEHRCWGLLYLAERPGRLRPGQRLDGYVKQVRADGRVDVTLRRPGGGRDRVEEAAAEILRQLDAAGGYLAFNDRSPPDAIYTAFGVSKKVFKQALGSLYKQRLVTLDAEGMARVRQ